MQSSWLVLDPNVHGGIYLAGDLNDVMSAILTSHLGGSRPSYAVEGMMYAKSISPGTVKLYYYDGTNDVEIGTVDTTQHTFAPAGVSSGVPTGTVMSYAGSTAPTGWLLCYGQAISRTTYSALFSIIGTQYGSGDGSSTFNLPDLRGRVLAGCDNMGGTGAARLTSTTMSPNGAARGSVGGAETHTLTTAQMPAHTHTAPARSPMQQNSSTDAFLYTNQQGSTTNILTSSVGSSAAHNNVQPTMVMNKMIKT